MSHKLLVPLFVISLMLSPGIVAVSTLESQTFSDGIGYQENIEALLSQELSDGEAIMWYLGHCGWAVKTRTKLLILDYWEQNPPRRVRSLTNGRINVDEIRSLDVFVFVSHDHGDHYDPVILEWADELPNVTYIFGWDAGLDPSFVYLSEERENLVFDGLEVSTVSHRFDNIPEVAYLLKLDGLTIYHSGDHASISETPNRTFAANIDFLAGKQDHVDIAFISTFGRRGGAIVNSGDFYTIERLSPQVVFPMHHGGGEDLYQRFANEVGSSIGSTSVVAARRLGDRFFFAHGRVQR
jgi:L-ascorbate metabolism protein UlaG (beta-lactamase superfamily)